MSTKQFLVRYGAFPQVEPFQSESVDPIARGTRVVVRTGRGEELGELLEDVPALSAPVASVSDTSVSGDNEEASGAWGLLRSASEQDLQRARQQEKKCESDFSLWQQRIDDWKLDLELIDLELTLDGQLLVLYVLNDRGPDCTRLALRVSAEGLKNVKVQPVDAGGPVAVTAAVGTGSCSSGGSCGCRS